MLISLCAADNTFLCVQGMQEDLQRLLIMAMVLKSRTGSGKGLLRHRISRPVVLTKAVGPSFC
jgi:hypothetical protein